MNALHIPHNRPIWLAIGSRRQEITVQTHPAKQSISISSELLQGTGLQTGQRIRLRYDTKQQALRIGPLIAVLLQSANHRSNAQKFGDMTPFCRELAAVARHEGAMLIVTTPKQLKHSQTAVNGWHFLGKWLPVKCPLPDVLYNRIQTRRAENTKKVRQVLTSIKSNSNTAIFNEQFLDKHAVFEALKQDDSLSAHLPHSVSCRTAQPVIDLLKDYRTVFLKPSTGSMGRGIVRIYRQPDGSYLTHATQLTGMSRKTFGDNKHLIRFLQPRLKKKLHIGQQGLSLLAIARHNLDFRILVQKDHTGKWGLTSMVARIASPRHFVSNVARGGRIVSVNLALAKAGISSTRRRRLAQSMQKLALQAADRLEQRLKIRLGELGVDLAVDKQLRIWLLEINSKPSKTDGLLPGAGKIRPSARKIIQYARHLSAFA